MNEEKSNREPIAMGQNGNPIPRVLNTQIHWEELYFYQKSEVVYHLAFAFCDRFIHLYKDRTRDQVIQAARSCKQNIVEGLADGVTSTEMQMKLLNVARASLQELRQDFYDYIIVNDDAEKAAQELSAIILAEHCRAADHMDLLKQV